MLTVADADWFYMWWILYTGNLHGSVYIMLKKSLQWIPLLGFGMKMYNFSMSCGPGYI